MKQEKENKEEFGDEATPQLNRQYNEGVLRREGSPEISKKKSTPAAPKKEKIKISNVKAIGKAKKKSLASEYPEDEKAVCVTYAMEGIIIRGEKGKVFDLKEVMMKKTEKGGRVLDKNASEIATNYKCGFWPVCGGSVSVTDPMVRGGILEEPKGHKKRNHLVFICGDHSVLQAEPDSDEEDDISNTSNSSISLRRAGLCEDTEDEDRGSGDDDEVDSKEGRKGAKEDLVADDDDQGVVVEDGSMEEEECEEEEEVEDLTLQSQSLLGGKK